MLDSYEKIKSQFNTELRIQEQLSMKYFLSVEEINLIVCLSGRGNFEQNFAEADKLKFIKMGLPIDNIDTSDTIRRLKASIAVGKMLFKKTGKHVPIYFNGVTEQNIYLREEISNSDMFMGYPSKNIIIEDIPIDTTIGQCIGLRNFVETKLGQYKKPNILIVSSSYHIPRVCRTFGNTSPLMSPEFYAQNESILEQLSDLLKEHVLKKDCVMRHATIFTYGIDKIISQVKGAEQAVRGELEAIWRYSSEQQVPSTAANLPQNCDICHIINRRAVKSASLFSPLENNLSESFNRPKLPRG